MARLEPENTADFSSVQNNPTRNNSAHSISDMLREARLARGLELRDISNTTHVRIDYLEALEEGRFEQLPESVYARNFLKLFAGAVGLDANALSERFAREVGAVGVQAGSSPLNAEVDERLRRPEERRVAWGMWLPGILLVAAVLGLTLWLFNAFLFSPTPAPTQEADVTDNIVEDSGLLPPADTATTDAASDTADTLPDTPSAADTLPEDASETVAETLLPPSEVSLSLSTTPPGAQVSIDNYALPGTTPIQDAPVSSGNARTVTITLDGYVPLTETVDLNEDSNLAFTLTSEADAAAAAESENAADAAANTDATDSSANPADSTTNDAADNAADNAADGAVAETDDSAAAADQLTLNVNEATWVEVYQSGARGQGERLVYETVQPGSTFTFDLPIYVHVGNANGVTVNLAGQDLGSLGSTGEVTGRAFTP